MLADTYFRIFIFDRGRCATTHSNIFLALARVSSTYKKAQIYWASNGGIGLDWIEPDRCLVAMGTTEYIA